VQPEEVPGFEDFSSKPPDQFLRRSTRVPSSGSTPPRKRIKVVHPNKYNLSHLTQPHEQPKQSFQSPSSEPKQADNVSGVPHNTFSGRTTFDSAGMEDLKMYMKGYVSKH